MQLQLASVFFTFSLGTRTHYFGRIILHGGAKVSASFHILSCPGDPWMCDIYSFSLIKSDRCNVSRMNSEVWVYAVSLYWTRVRREAHQLC